MYSCDIIEFSPLSGVGIACHTFLVFMDQYAIYDKSLTPRFELPTNSGGTWASVDGIWINTKPLSLYSKCTSRRLSIKSWEFEGERNYESSDSNAEIGETVFVVEDCDGGEIIVAYNQKSQPINKINLKRLRYSLVAHHNHIYAIGRDGVTYCLDSNLVVVWSVKKEKKLYSSDLVFPIPFDDLIIINFG